MVKTTQEQVDTILGEEYKALEPYTNNSTKFKILHTICGRTSNITYANFKDRGSRCIHCSGVKPKTSLEFAKEVYTITDGEYESLCDYTSARALTTIVHNKCGRIYQISANKFLSGRRCVLCEPLKIPEKLQNILKSKEYSLVDEYEGSNVKTRFLHNSCSNTFSIAPSKLMSGGSCNVCSQKGLDVNKPAILYSFTIKGLQKVGITTQSIKERYIKRDRDFMDNLIEIGFGTAKEAMAVEKRIKKACAKYRYTGESPFSDGRTGTTEVFYPNTIIEDIICQT